MISVIIPAYNAAQTIKRCVDSILAQTYKDIEILIVNDGSTDNTYDIAISYAKRYSNIRVFNHDKNKGLFSARLTGVHNAKGEFIAFVDSDDYVSVDFYRLLWRKAIAYNADIVYSSFYLDYSNKKIKYFNNDPISNQELVLYDENVMKSYMEQAGAFYGWHLVWNKLYRYDLWMKCIERLDVFSANNPNLNMTEDIAFTMALMCHAKTVVNEPNAVYYYFRSDSQMTANKKTLKSNVKKLKDVETVFDFFKTYLSEMNLFDKYGSDYYLWRKRYGYIYCGILSENEKWLSYIDEHFLKYSEDIQNNAKSSYFYRLETEVSNNWFRFEKIKKCIASEKIKIVSFDIFDTCLLRNVWNPTDVFVFLNSFYENITGVKTVIDYAGIRVDSEIEARAHKKNGKEDVTLDEIFDVMQKKFGIKKEICESMKEKEVELELTLSRPRKFVKELYSLALDMKKTVIFTSDMYLPKKTIEELLDKNGYNYFDGLYISGDQGVTKTSGKLYKKIVNIYGVKNSEIMHIGDNFKSDYVVPKILGIKSFYLQSVRKCFTGSSIWKKIIDHNCNDMDMKSAVDSFIGYRTMLALVANRIYDNPYISYNKHSDFNASPLVIGYYILGMYLLSVTVWLKNNVLKRTVVPKTIHFVARDGYLVKNAYDLLYKGSGYPKSNYLYVSRKAMMLANVYSKEDLLSIVDDISFLSYTPIKFFQLFRKYIKKDDLVAIAKQTKKDGYALSKKFISRIEFRKFLGYFINKYYEKIEWEKTKTCITQYLQDNVEEGDVLFDIGYSGRTESVINSLLGIAIDSYYIHSNSDTLDRRKRKFEFDNRLFYDYKPRITGVVRERVFMKNSPSVIGYRINEQREVEPVFEQYLNTFADNFSTGLLQKYAMEFVGDVVRIFGSNSDEFYFRYEDAAQPFEFFLHHGLLFDRKIFSDLLFEDDFARGDRFNAVDFWTKEMIRKNSKTKMEYAYRIFMMDKKNFAKKCIKHLIKKVK